MLLAGGDSFTWGNELPDCNPTSPSRLTWASLLSEKLGLDYRCVAAPGIGNKSISRRVIREIHNNPGIRRVAVMWTFPIRHDISIRPDLACKSKNTLEEIDDGWLTLSVYRSIPWEERLDRFPKNLQDDISFVTKMKNLYRFEQYTGIGALSEQIMNIASDEYHIHETLMNIFCLQSFLKDKNIPFVFCSNNDAVLEHIKSERVLASCIDKTCWIRTDKGFLEWAKASNYEISGMGHPGPQAHSNWFKESFANTV